MNKHHWDKVRDFTPYGCQSSYSGGFQRVIRKWGLKIFSHKFLVVINVEFFYQSGNSYTNLLTKIILFDYFLPT